MYTRRERMHIASDDRDTERHGHTESHKNKQENRHICSHKHCTSRRPHTTHKCVQNVCTHTLSQKAAHANKSFHRIWVAERTHRVLHVHTQHTTGTSKEHTGSRIEITGMQHRHRQSASMESDHQITVGGGIML